MAFSTNGGTTFLAAVAYTATASLTLSSGDGLYTIAVLVTDVAGNSTIVTRTIRLDTTGPAISYGMIAPTNSGFYDVGTTITFNFSASDFDNVASLSAKLDSATTLTNGQVIDVDKLKAGTHTIVLTSTDQLGNSSSVTVTFQVHATVAGQINAVNKGAAAGLITSVQQSKLTALLQIVQYYLNAGNTASAKSALNNYISWVQLNSGKSINAAYAALLINWAQHLYNRL
ncbi:MAG TPA: hypothetical protein VIP52_11970 [Candidatus Dormibacteraeota bacterium]